MASKTVSTWFSVAFGVLVIVAGWITSVRFSLQVGIALVLVGAGAIAEAVHLRTESRWAKRVEWGLLASLAVAIFWRADSIYLYVAGISVLVILLPALSVIVPALPVYWSAKRHGYTFREIAGSGLTGRDGARAIDAALRLRSIGEEFSLNDANVFARLGGNLEQLADAAEIRVSEGLPPDLFALQAASLAGHDPRSLSEHPDAVQGLVALEKQRGEAENSSPRLSS